MKMQPIDMQPMSRIRGVPTGDTEYFLTAKGHGLIGHATARTLGEAQDMIAATFETHGRVTITIRQIPRYEYRD